MCGNRLKCWNTMPILRPHGCDLAGAVFVEAVDFVAVADQVAVDADATLLGDPPDG